MAQHSYYNRRYYDGKLATVTSLDNANERPYERIMPKSNMSNSRPASKNRLEELTGLADVSTDNVPIQTNLEQGTVSSMESSSSSSSSRPPGPQSDFIKRRFSAEVDATSRRFVDKEWWTKDEKDMAKEFSSFLPLLVHVHDSKDLVPAITISKNLGTRISRAIAAERRYKSLWTKIDDNDIRTQDKKSKILKDIENFDEELTNHDATMWDSSSPLNSRQRKRRQDLVTRAFLARKEFDHIIDNENWLWADCNSAEQACRDAWEDVGALLRSAWLRAGLTQPDPIDDKILPRGEERGITRRLVSETPATSLGRIRDSVHQYANALRKARDRFEDMCHHYSSWAPWEDGIPGDFRDSVVKPAFMDMLQCEKAKLEDAKRDYRRAIGRAWREKIPHTDLDLGYVDDLESVETKLLEGEDAWFIREGPINAVEIWRRQNPNRAPSEKPLYPTSEERNKEDIHPWESKSRFFTDLASKQRSASLERKRPEPPAKKVHASRGEDRYGRRRKAYLDDSPKAFGPSIHARDSRARVTSAPTKHRQAREPRRLMAKQPCRQTKKFRHMRLPITSFFKKRTRTA
ncbi:hypothetical protein B0T12DRAFT_389714 [Alternaria alternata]|nr:hypothetical protein B0T12DRAFT_389714 [Alternaria alternata]